MELNPGEIVKQYEIERERYNKFSESVSNLIGKLLDSEKIAIHSISHRCKTVGSLKGKVENKTKYKELSDITDLAGVRLITHYGDDVDRIAKIIEGEFSVDRDNSIDKRAAIEPDKFGYLSLHYVLSLRPERARLKEYEFFDGLKVEVQIRSLLQHTWAEIEHDTGYKSEVEVPKHIRRRFSRLAGLLEIADTEFTGIRNELYAYAEEVKCRVEQSSSTEGEADFDLTLDKISLQKFIELDSVVRQFDEQIEARLGIKLSNKIFVDSSDISNLREFGVMTLGDLRSALAEYRDLIELRLQQVVKDCSSYTSHSAVDRGMAIPMLIHALIATKIPEHDRFDALERLGFAPSASFDENLAELAFARANTK